MKNLKKVLSVALALAMALSLMTTAFAAVPKASDLTGNDKVGATYTQAVDMMVGLGVINGVSGDVQAQGNVTREQAAKMVCTMLLGSDASQLSTTNSYFSDVAATRWSAPYIAYCVENGIVSGVGGGKFNPTGNVTGNQFAKMLLVALGYNATSEGYTGTNWAVNVSGDATEAGIYNSAAALNKNAAATREQACLYAWNTICATLVEYTSAGTSITIGDTSINVGGSKATEVTSKTLASRTNLDGTNADPDKAYTIQFGEKYFTTLKKTNTPADAFGRPASEYKIGSTSIGTYADDTTLIGTYTGYVSKGTLYTLIGKTVYNELLDTDASNTLTTYVDGYETELIKSTDDSTRVADNADDYFISGSATKFVGARGATTEVYMDSNDNVTIVIANTFLVKAAADYNSTKATLTVTPLNGLSLVSGGNVISNASVPVSGFSSGDYILVTASHAVSSGSYTIQSATAAEKVSGVVSTVTNANNNAYTSTATIGGTAYYPSYVLAANGATLADLTVDATAQVVLDGQGNVIYVDDATLSSGNYVYISKFATASNLSSTAIAKAYFADGTTAEITLKSVDGVTAADTIGAYSSTTALAKVNCHWYTYTVNSAGNYVLTSPKADTYTNGYATVSNGVTAITNNAVTIGAAYDNVATTPATETATVKANAATIFVVLDKNNNVTTYTGIAKVPTIVGIANIFATYKTANSYASYVFIDATSGTVNDTSTVTSDLVYLLNYTGSVSTTSGVTYTTYKAVINGAAPTTIQLTSDWASGTPDEYTLYYSPKVDSNGRYTGATKVTTVANTKNFNSATIGGPVTYSSGVLTLANTDYVLASDASIVVISKAANINSDSTATYEVNTYTGLDGAKSLAGILNGYSVTGSYAGLYTSSTNTSVATLYVTVDSCAQLYTIAAPSDVTAQTPADAAHYTVTASARAATAETTITVTIHYDGQAVTDTTATVTVTDASGHNVSVSGTQTFTSETGADKTVTFTMPSDSIATIATAVSHV